VRKKSPPTKQAAPRPYRYAAKKSASSSRIAEPVAVYSAARPSAIKQPRRITERRIAGLVASEEVWRFAAAHDLTPHLETAVRLVRECFLAVSEIRLLHQVDWDSENNSWVVVDIKITGTQDAIIEQYDRFTRQMVRQLPPEKGEKIVLSF